MIIKLSDSLQYEVVSAKKVSGKIVAIREDGTEIVVGGDLSSIAVIGGELETPYEPNPEPEQPSETSVWDELDAAYQEGVDSV